MRSLIRSSTSFRSQFGQVGIVATVLARRASLRVASINEGWRWSSEWDPRKAVANLAKHKVSFEGGGDRLRRSIGSNRRLIRVIQPQRNGWYCWAFLKSGVYWPSCTPSARRLFASSAPDGPHAPREETMKKSVSKDVVADRVANDEILPEYDFKRGSPNKFASRYAAGSTVIVLEPDVAATFPSSGGSQ